VDQNTLKVILFFNSSLASGKNKEYSTAVFKHWLKSCKELLLEHFAENCMTPRCTVATLWCHKLCAVFLEHPVHYLLTFFALCVVVLVLAVCFTCILAEAMTGTSDSLWRHVCQTTGDFHYFCTAVDCNLEGCSLRALP